MSTLRQESSDEPRRRDDAMVGREHQGQSNQANALYMNKQQLNQQSSPSSDQPLSGRSVGAETRRLSALIALTAAAVLTTTTAKAQHIWEDPGTWAGGVISYDHKTAPLFSANELSMDLGASYFAGQRGVEHVFETNIKGARATWGGDVGLNYFITQYFGVGADVNMAANGGNLVDAVLGNMTLRLPLGNSGFAPYLLGGGGRTTDHTWTWVGQAGMGIEFRPSHNVGIFTDARFLWPQHGSDALLLRAGIRLIF